MLKQRNQSVVIKTQEGLPEKLGHEGQQGQLCGERHQEKLPAKEQDIERPSEEEAWHLLSQTHTL